MVEPSSASGASLGVAGPPVHQRRRRDRWTCPGDRDTPEPITHSLDTLYVPDLSTLPRSHPRRASTSTRPGCSTRPSWCGAQGDHPHPRRTRLQGAVQAGHPGHPVGGGGSRHHPLRPGDRVLPVKRFNTGGIPFALYAFVGIMCWSFFASSLSSGGTSLLNNKALLSKTQFPRECFPLESMAVNASTPSSR